jgi:hypothetical protein
MTTATQDRPRRRPTVRPRQQPLTLAQLRYRLAEVIENASRALLDMTAEQVRYELARIALLADVDNCRNSCSPSDYLDFDDNDPEYIPNMEDL